MAKGMLHSIPLICIVIWPVKVRPKVTVVILDNIHNQEFLNVLVSQATRVIFSPLLLHHRNVLLMFIRPASYERESEGKCRHEQDRLKLNLNEFIRSNYI